jgi:hypothetical protein
MTDLQNESGHCCFWPVLLFILAFNCFLIAEVHFAWRALDRLQIQKKNAITRVEQSQAQVAAARTWMAILEGVCNDLLDLSKSDSEVRRVVEKYQIRRNQPVPLPTEEGKDKAEKPAS